MIQIAVVEIGGPLINAHSSVIHKSRRRFSSESVRVLNSILHQFPNLMLCISSSLPKLSEQRARDLFVANKVFDSENRIVGFIPNLNTSRGYEIDTWLRDPSSRRLGIQSFVIIDDGHDMIYRYLRERLTRTPYETGLTTDHIPQITRILSKPWKRPAL